MLGAATPAAAAGAGAPALCGVSVVPPPPGQIRVRLFQLSTWEEVVFLSCVSRGELVARSSRCCRAGAGVVIPGERVESRNRLLRTMLGFQCKPNTNPNPPSGNQCDRQPCLPGVASHRHRLGRGSGSSVPKRRAGNRSGAEDAPAPRGLSAGSRGFGGLGSDGDLQGAGRRTDYGVCLPLQQMDRQTNLSASLRAAPA